MRISDWSSDVCSSDLYGTEGAAGRLPPPVAGCYNATLYNTAAVSRQPGVLRVGPMFLLIDNYDSFVYNLMHFLGELGAEVEVRRNDALTVDEALAMEPEGIVISPGPCDPDKAGICLDLIREAAGRVPILGVCLGHQAIGQAFGGKVVRPPRQLGSAPCRERVGQYG